MSNLATRLQINPRDAEHAEAAGRLAWAQRRKWSRTETGRWLNDRSEAVLAWLRRKPGTWPTHSRQVGYWLKDFQAKIFDRAHTRLAAAVDDDAREAMLPGEVLR